MDENGWPAGRSPRRTRQLSVLVGWVAGLAAVGCFAWLALGLAGQQVTDPIPSAPATGAAADVTPRLTPTADGSSGDPADVALGVAGRSGQDERRPSEPPSPTGSQVNAATLTTTGGRLRVQCTGPDASQVSLEGGYAQPASGWGVKVASSGPDVVRVLFLAQPRGGITIDASCNAGRPVFEQLPGLPGSRHRTQRRSDGPQDG